MRVEFPAAAAVVEVPNAICPKLLAFRFTYINGLVIPWSEMTKAGVVLLPTSSTARVAHGLVVPMPTLPPLVAKYAALVEEIWVVLAYPSVVSPVTFKVEVAVIAPPKKEVPET